MKLTAGQYCCVYFCMFEEPAMFKPLSYLSEFLSIRQSLVLLTDNANFKAKTFELAVQIYLCQWRRISRTRSVCPKNRYPLKSNASAATKNA